MLCWKADDCKLYYWEITTKINDEELDYCQPFLTFHYGNYGHMLFIGLGVPNPHAQHTSHTF